jgi:opacity protein-like surface antigen
VVDPEHASSTVLLGAHVDAGEIVPHFHLVPNLEYWSVGVAGYDTSDLGFGLDANLDFPLQGSAVTPYAGGGLGLHFFSLDVPPGFVGDDSKTKLGLNLQGGVREEFMPNLSGFAELRYSFVSDFNQLKLLGGFTYHFVY